VNKKHSSARRQRKTSMKRMLWGAVEVETNKVSELKEGNNRKPREGLKMKQTYRIRHI
jgi:hypothetical protein